MINYYDICVSAARMINKPRAAKKEIKPLVKRMFGYTGKQFEEQKFDAAFTEFNKAKVAKAFRPIYA